MLVVNHATADGRDATFDRFVRTPAADDFDGPVHVGRVGRWANVAKLDVAPGLPAALRRLHRDPPDVWHLHVPNVTMMLGVLSCPRIRPLVITHHSDIIRQRVLKYAVRPLEHAVYRRAARVLATSAVYAAGSELLKRYADRVVPVPLGIDLTPFRNPSRAALEHADRFRKRFGGAPLWLCAGRLIYYKGLGIALEALRSVPGNLVVIGTGPLTAELRQRTKDLGVADRVIWYGHASADELVGAYHAATALWFPSVARSEAFGLVQVEAMAAGCPVVNTAIPASGVPWVCPHEVAGLTAPVGDPEAFAAAANRLLTEPGLRHQLIAGGRARAAAEFDWMVMGERSLDVYRAVANRRS
ncbi:MAG: glycosyl transferase family 1 [Gemmataceae bacterium]|nr:glycosyl transferase family 1 [Gemmataceae bacterium]